MTAWGQRASSRNASRLMRRIIGVVSALNDQTQVALPARARLGRFAASHAARTRSRPVAVG